MLIYILPGLHYRFAEPEDCPPMMDLLWSDPMAEENIEDMNGQ